MMPAEVTLPSTREVRVTRHFVAAPAFVWRAYTEPALMQRWLLGPPGWEMPVCEMDVTVGGAYRWRWRNTSNGSEFGFEGRFREVVEATRLVETQIYDPGTTGGDMGAECLIEIDFTAEGAGTLLTTRIHYASQKDRDAALATGMTDGMEASFATLDRIIGDADSEN